MCGGSGGGSKGGGGGQQTAMSSVDERVNNNLDTRIAALDAKAASESAIRARMNHEANPEMDIGGIRSKSAKAKERNFDSMLNHAKRGLEAAKERDDLIQVKKNYAKFNATAKAAETMIARGSRKDGTPFSKSELKEIKAIAQDNTKWASNIRIKYG